MGSQGTEGASRRLAPLVVAHRGEDLDRLRDAERLGDVARSSEKVDGLIGDRAGLVAPLAAARA